MHVRMYAFICSKHKRNEAATNERKKSIFLNFSAATAKRERDCASRGRISGTHLNLHGIYEMLVNGIIVAVHGVCLNVNGFRCFSVSVRFFLSDVGKIADSDAQYSQSNHFGNCRLFGVFIFLPSATHSVFIVRTHTQTYTRNFSLCILPSHKPNAGISGTFKAKAKGYGTIFGIHIYIIFIYT